MTDTAGASRPRRRREPLRAAPLTGDEPADTVRTTTGPDGTGGSAPVAGEQSTDEPASAGSTGRRATGPAKKAAAKKTAAKKPAGATAKKAAAKKATGATSSTKKTPGKVRWEAAPSTTADPDPAAGPADTTAAASEQGRAPAGDTGQARTQASPPGPGWSRPSRHVQVRRLSDDEVDDLRRQAAQRKAALGAAAVGITALVFDRLAKRASRR